MHPTLRSMTMKNVCPFRLVVLPTIVFAVALLTGCTEETKHFPAPSTDNTPTKSITIKFNDPILSGAPDRNNKCKWFDGVMNTAQFTTVETYGSVNGTLAEIIPMQSFYAGDFAGATIPNVEVPESGFFVQIVTVFGQNDPDCCPPPPTGGGTPVYKIVWGPTMSPSVTQFKMLPEFIYCLPF
jgi:hypothetical protein